MLVAPGCFRVVIHFCGLVPSSYGSGHFAHGGRLSLFSRFVRFNIGHEVNAFYTTSVVLIIHFHFPCAGKREQMLPLRPFPPRCYTGVSGRSCEMELLGRLTFPANNGWLLDLYCPFLLVLHFFLWLRYFLCSIISCIWLDSRVTSSFGLLIHFTCP